MIIYGLKDLDHYILRDGDIVIFHVKDKDKQEGFISLSYEVYPNFLMSIQNIFDASPSDKYFNDGIFTVLKLDPYKFCSKYYGYESKDGIWPCYENRDFKAITNVVKALYTLIDTMNVSKSVEYWRPSTNHIKESITKSKKIRTIKQDNDSKLKRI